MKGFLSLRCLAWIMGAAVTHSLRAEIMRHLLILACLLFGTGATADEADFDFKSLGAKKALRDYKATLVREDKAKQKAIEEIEAEAKKERKKYRVELIMNLEQALKKALQDADLEEANKIDAAIKCLTEGTAVPVVTKNEPPTSKGNTKKSKNIKRIGLRFNGNGYLQSNLRYRGATPITLEATVIPSSNNSYEPIIVGNTESSGVELLITKSGRWGFGVHDGDNYKTAKSKSLFQPGKRVALAGVYDGETVKLFVDGKLQSTTRIASHNASKYPFYIGGGPTPERSRGADSKFSGVIEEVRISSGALYSKSYKPANEFNKSKGTVLLLNLNDGKGNMARDESNNGNHCRIVNAEWVSN